MATANFYARLERIEQAQENMVQIKSGPVRELQSTGPTRMAATRARRHPIFEHLIPMLIGVVLGCIAAVIHLGLNTEGTPWGPGTGLNDLMRYPAMAGFAAAPLLIVISLFIAARKPGFALFSLGYLSGLTVLMFI